MSQHRRLIRRFPALIDADVCVADAHGYYTHQDLIVTRPLKLKCFEL
jgi:hypothetical protein